MSEPLPAPVSLTLYRGDTRVWTVVIESNTGTARVPVYVPYDLTGHAVLTQIRTNKNRLDPVISTITAEITDAPAGVVTLTLTSAEADKLGTDGSKLWWDLQTTRAEDGFRRTWLAGPVTVRGDVSNA